MPIYDQSFRRYTGPRSMGNQWWAVAYYTWRPILRRWLVWVLLAGLLLYLGGMSVAFVVAAKVAQTIGDQNTGEAMHTVRREGLPIFDATVGFGTILYTVVQPLKVLLWLLVLITGAGAISVDRRYNALPLYFSRPLVPWQYLLGKIVGMALIPLAALLLTQWIIGLQFIAWYLPASAILKEMPKFLFGAVYAVLMAGFLATAMAAFSSMVKSARIAGVAFLCFFVLLERVVPLVASGSSFPFLMALSPLHSMDVIGQGLLRPDLSTIKSSVDTGALSLTASVVCVAGYLALFLTVLRRNLRVVEVVK